VAGKPQPGAGVLPAEWLDAGFLVAAMRKVTSGQALRESLVRYGEPMGDSRLREALARRLQRIGIAVGLARSSPPWGDPGAGHREPSPAAARRSGDGGRAGLGRGICAPGRHGHARAAGATRPEGPDMAVMQRYARPWPPSSM
jgi:hypothetical protein